MFILRKMTCYGSLTFLLTSFHILRNSYVGNISLFHDMEEKLRQVDSSNRYQPVVYFSNKSYNDMASRSEMASRPFRRRG